MLRISQDAVLGVITRWVRQDFMLNLRSSPRPFSTALFQPVQTRITTMPTSVRSHTKINLGLAIGPLRPDGFHQLTTVYQTLALHERVMVEARIAPATTIALSSNNPRVPTDARNTAWRIVERCLEMLQIHAEVHIHIDKQ